MATPAVVSQAEEEATRVKAIEDELLSLTAALGHPDVDEDSIVIDQSAELGRGTFGVVNRGTLQQQGKVTQVAVKSLFTNVKQLQFLREVRAMALLSEEPHVVRLLGWGRSPHARIVLELLHCDLRHFIRTHDNISWKQRTTWALHMCSAIAAAHKLGVFHRDIKPSNLLVAEDGWTLKVSDFGQAYVKARVDDDTTMHAHAEGSRRYWSPELYNYKKPPPKDKRTPAEQAEMKDFHRRADVWAIGGTLHFIITGLIPFSEVPDANLSAIMIAGPDYHTKLLKLHLLLRQKPDECPAQLFSSMIACFNLDSTRRPTAEQLVKDINNVLNGMPDEPAAAPAVAAATAAASAPAVAVVPAHGDDNASTAASSGDGHSSSQNSRFEGHTDSSTAPTLDLATASVAGSGNAAHLSYGRRPNLDDPALLEDEPSFSSMLLDVVSAAAGLTWAGLVAVGSFVSQYSSSQATLDGEQSQPAAASSSSSSAAAAAASSAAAAGPAAAAVSTAVAFSSRQSHGSPRHASSPASTSSTHSSSTHASMPPAVPYTPLPMCAPVPVQRSLVLNPVGEVRTPSPALGKRTRSAMNSVSPPAVGVAGAAASSAAAASSSRMDVVDEARHSIGAASSSSAAAAADAAAAAMGTRSRPLQISSDSEDDRLPKVTPSRRLRARTASSFSSSSSPLARWEGEGVSPEAPLSPEDVAFAQAIQTGAALLLRSPHARAASESQAPFGAAAAAAAPASNHARRASGRRDPAAAMHHWQ